MREVGRSAGPGSPFSRVFFALAFVVPGILLVGVGTRVVEVDPSTVHAPYWLIGMLGGMFTLAGLWLVTQGTFMGAGLKHVVGPTIMIGILVALHWVAFGPGVRSCSGGIALPFLSAWTGVGDVGCRAAFGFGALFFDGILASAVLARAAERWLEGPLRSAAEALSKGVLLLVLLPLLPLLLLALLLQAGAGRLRKS